MKAIILVAGYNTRLLKLTNNVPKALLRIGQVAIIEKILSEVILVDNLSEVVIVSNSKFFSQFNDWLNAYKKSMKPTITISLIDDGTWTNETRRGAVGDFIFAIEQKKIDDDILLLACDNLFEADLNTLCSLGSRKSASVVAAYKFDSLDDVRKKFGVIQTTEGNRVLTFQEKPEHPLSSIAATAIYFFKKEHLPAILTLANKQTDNEINLGEIIIELLRQNMNVYSAFVTSWFDIGSPEDLKKAEVFFVK